MEYDNISDMERAIRTDNVSVSGLWTVSTVNTSGAHDPGPTTTNGPLRMEPYSLAHLLATAIVLGTVILATMIGNIFVIAAIVLERNLHNVANYLIASLATADLLVAALVMPLAAVNEVSKQWFLGAEVCDMFVSFDVLCCTSSILHLVCISMDRYWAVTRVDYIHQRSARQILIMIGFSWAISAGISIPPLFGWKDSNDPNETGVCLISQDWGYTVFSTVGAFYLPLVVMIAIYYQVYRAAKSRIRRRHFRSAGVSKDGAPRPLLGPNSQTDTTVLNSETTTPVATSNSPEPSFNGCVQPNDSNRNNNKHILAAQSPPASPMLLHPNSSSSERPPNERGSWLDLTKLYFDKKHTTPATTHAPSPKHRRPKEKLEQKRERKAARTLAIITGSFIVCWLPFFILAIVRPFCRDWCNFPELLYSVINWLGYFNSLLNPVIYTIFNPDFRSAFRKILFGKYRHQNMRRRMMVR